MRDAANLTSCSDEDLFGCVRRGDAEAFATLVRRYEREMYGYLRRYVGDATLADDVFQNTFMQMYLKRDAFEPGRRVKPWMYAIATNQAIDAMRRRGRRNSVSLEQQTGTDAEGEVNRLLDLLESRGSSPLDGAALDETQKTVRNGVDQLPDFLRDVVILVYFQGLPYRDAAEALGIPVGTVKSRLNAALHRLHETWSACPSGAET